MASLPQIGAMNDPQKWGLPGWRIEQRYDPKVLIGNWHEERGRFERTTQKHNSTQRRDFKFYPNARPDVEVRRNAFLTNKGLSKEMVFGHHGEAYSNNMITIYDEYYNKRDRPGRQAFPPVRSWDAKTMTWVPEKIDYPLQGEATNWGLKEAVAEKQARLEKEKTISDYTSTYQLGYTEKPLDMQTSRYATARSQSTKLLPVNRTNKNFNLRSVTMVNPQMPQSLQVPRPYVI
ncbi:cilia- and flagella-associated protein 107-like [Watersipora subatra]|uniref:cilia- and flagella-associated protein 107-like n=1 Tax=Watersipora subatra TaxID=2589382 RepID=UPI00355C33D6